LRDADCAAANRGHIKSWKDLAVLQARHRGLPKMDRMVHFIWAAHLDCQVHSM
jgi:hypothetical protein